MKPIRLHDRVRKELVSSSPRPDLWAQAMQLTRSETAAKEAYIKLRAAELLQEDEAATPVIPSAPAAPRGRTIHRRLP